MEKELIEKFEKIINEYKYHNISIYIIYNMSCNDNYRKLDIKGKYKLMELIYEIYIKDESQTDIGAFSDAIMNNYKLALKGGITKHNIYNFI